MSQSKFIKTMAVLLIALAVLTVVNLLLKRGSGPSSVGGETFVPTPLPGQVVLSNDQLPKGFTKDMILSEDVEIIDSYEYSEEGQSDNHLQSTVRYVASDKAVWEVFDFYYKFFQKNQWSANPNYTLSSTLATYEGSKQGQKLMITIATNTTTGKVVVDVTLVSDKTKAP